MCYATSDYQIGNNQYCRKCVTNFRNAQEKNRLAFLNSKQLNDKNFGLFCLDDEVDFTIGNYSFLGCRFCLMQHQDYPCKVNGCSNTDLREVYHWTKFPNGDCILMNFSVCVPCCALKHVELDQSLSIIASENP